MEKSLVRSLCWSDLDPDTRSAVPRLALIALRATPTNVALARAAEPHATGLVLEPGEALLRLGAGDTAVGRLDVLPGLDGMEPGSSALERLTSLGVRVLNPPAALVAAHDKLVTARRLRLAGVPHPVTAHLTAAYALPAVTTPVVLKPRFGSWGGDIVLCPDRRSLHVQARALERRPWFAATGALVQELVAPQGFDLRLVVARGEVVGAVRRIAAAGEWRTNVSLGAVREPVMPAPEASQLALAAAAAIGADLVGVDLLPLPGGGWTVLELNGAVDFTAAYGPDVFRRAVAALVGRKSSGSDAVRAPLEAVV